MKKWFLVPVVVLGFVMSGTLGCGSNEPKVIQAPVVDEDPMPGVDRNSAEYQKSMSGQ